MEPILFNYSVAEFKFVVPLSFLQSSELNLGRTPSNVEEFVEHLAFLARMANEIPSLEKEYHIVSGLFQIATKFSLEFSAEEWALYQTLGPSFNQLKVIFCNFFISSSQFVIYSHSL